MGFKGDRLLLLLDSHILRVLAPWYCDKKGYNTSGIEICHGTSKGARTIGMWPYYFISIVDLNHSIWLIR